MAGRTPGQRSPDNAVAAPQVDRSLVPIWKRVEKRPGTDVQLGAGEDTGVHDDAEASVEVDGLRPWVGTGKEAGVKRRVNQPSLFLGERRRGGPDDPFEELQRGGMDVFHHSCANDPCVGRANFSDLVQLMFEQRQCSGNLDYDDVGCEIDRFGARQEAHAGTVILSEVLLSRAEGDERV